MPDLPPKIIDWQIREQIELYSKRQSLNNHDIKKAYQEVIFDIKSFDVLTKNPQIILALAWRLTKFHPILS